MEKYVSLKKGGHFQKMRGSQHLLQSRMQGLYDKDRIVSLLSVLLKVVDELVKYILLKEKYKRYMKVTQFNFKTILTKCIVIYILIKYLFETSFISISKLI